MNFLVSAFLDNLVPEPEYSFDPYNFKDDPHLELGYLKELLKILPRDNPLLTDELFKSATKKIQSILWFPYDIEEFSKYTRLAFVYIKGKGSKIKSFAYVFQLILEMKDNKAYNRRLVFQKDLKHFSDWESPIDQSECSDTEEVTSTSLITGLTNSAANNPQLTNNNQSGTRSVSGTNQQITFLMFEFYQNGNLAIVNVTVEKQDIFKFNKTETVLQANIYHDLIGCPSTSPKPTPTPTTMTPTTPMTPMTEEEPEDYTMEEHTPEEYTSKKEEITTIRATKKSSSFKWLWLSLIVIVILILTLCVYCVASSHRRYHVAVTPGPMGFRTLPTGYTRSGFGTPIVTPPPPQDEKVKGKDIKGEDVKAEDAKGKEKSLTIEKGFGTEKSIDLTGVRRSHIQTDIGKSMPKFHIEKSTKSLFQPTPSMRSFHKIS